jgi:hypothetical protein
MRQVSLNLSSAAMTLGCGPTTKPLASVARIERSEIRDILAAWFDIGAISSRAEPISSPRRSWKPTLILRATGTENTRSGSIAIGSIPSGTTEISERHVDYIHFNPIKHGLVTRVRDWPQSSFHRYVRRGLLPEDWAGEFSPEQESFGERKG